MPGTTGSAPPCTTRDLLMPADADALIGEDDLRHGSDAEPGIRRHGTRRLRYVDDRTGRAPSAADIERIDRLAVPPAWTDVWIASDPTSHLQATGRDARGRKQYRYHSAFSAGTAAQKFGQLHHFGASLGALRRSVHRDLHTGNALDHDQVVAVVVRLLDITSLRVGNEHYARENRSFGLTTLRDRHAAVRGERLRLGFVGKSKRRFDIEVDNPVLARLVRRCQDLPGQMLFQYRDLDGAVRPVTSQDVNAYLAAHCWPGATAKTFRTWNASVAAGRMLAAAGDDGPPSRSTLNAVIDAVADELGNTRSVCRQSYVHPDLPASYLDGSLTRRWNRPPTTRPSGLTADERRLLRLVRRTTRTRD